MPSPRPSAPRRISLGAVVDHQLGDVDRRISQPGVLGGELGGDGPRQVPQTGWCDSMRWSIPWIQTGLSEVTWRSPAAMITAAAPSEIGGRSCVRSGAEKYGAPGAARRSRPSHLRVRVLLRAATAASDHLGEVPLAGLARPAAPAPGCRRATRDPSRGSHHVVGLEREHLAGRPGDDFPDPITQDVDVAQLQPQPGFEQRPRRPSIST